MSSNAGIAAQTNTSTYTQHNSLSTEAAFQIMADLVVQVNSQAVNFD